MVCSVQPDQQLVVRLGKRVQRHKTVCARKGSRVVLLLFEQSDKTVQYTPEPVPVLFAHRNEPLIIQGREEVVLIKLSCDCERVYLLLAILSRSRGGRFCNRRLEIE